MSLVGFVLFEKLVLIEFHSQFETLFLFLYPINVELDGSLESTEYVLPLFCLFARVVLHVAKVHFSWKRLVVFINRDEIDSKLAIKQNAQFAVFITRRVQKNIELAFLFSFIKSKTAADGLNDID